MVQCRSCLSTTAIEYTDMTTFISGNCSFLEFFEQCTQLNKKTDNDDELPLTMCNGCSRELVMIFEFVKMSRQADEILRENLASKKDKVCDIEREEIELLEENGVEGSEEIVEHLELFEETGGDECIVEEILDDEGVEITEMEVVEMETVDSEALEGSMENVEYIDEKSQIEILDLKANEFVQDENILTKSNLNMKEESAAFDEYYPEDELDDEYLIEYTENEDIISKDNAVLSTKLAPNGAKWKCFDCKRVLHGDVSYVGHMNMHMGMRPYKCRLCRCAFRCKYALERHAALRHQTKSLPESDINFTEEEDDEQEEENSEEENITINCPKCTKIFNSESLFKEHTELVHLNATSIQCPHCSSLPPLTRTKLVEHFRTEHPAEHRKHFPTVGRPCNDPAKITPWQCDICMRFLRSESLLQDHRNTHLNERPHKCDFCQKPFAAASNLRTHLRTWHPQEYDKTAGEDSGEVQCEICKKQLLRRNLEKHLALHEKKEREAADNQTKFLCAYCSRECKSKKALNQHEKMHEGESADVYYVCSECDRHYATQNLLENHKKQAHKARDNVCLICGNAFKLKNQLLNHMKLHLEKNIQCPHCDKKYARKFDLDVHLRSHTGEMPYPCHLCDKKFAIKVRLTYHLQKHYGVKHSCKLCGSEFNSKQKLKTHSYKHTGMPYRCNLCNNHGFANRDVFKRHLLRVHSVTMSEESLVEMFQRNTGKMTRILQVKKVDNTNRSAADEILEDLIDADDIAMGSEIIHH